MEESKQKLSQPFVPIPISFLNQVIANENIPLSHRVLAVILWKMFDTRKKERDKLTVSYIAKVLKTKDRRDIRKVIETLCKAYPFYIENNGQGRTNKILLQSCGEIPTSALVGNMPQAPVGNMPQVPVGNMPQVPVGNMPQVLVGKMPHNIDIEDSIESSIEYVDTTGDEWC